VGQEGTICACNLLFSIRSVRCSGLLFEQRALLDWKGPELEISDKDCIGTKEKTSDESRALTKELVVLRAGDEGAIASWIVVCEGGW